MIDAGVRDTSDLRRMGFPVWSQYVSCQGTVKATPGSVNVPVVIGGVTIHPGDVICADDDGVVAVGRDEAAWALERSLARLDKEAGTRAQLEAGVLGVDLYGLRPSSSISASSTSTRTGRWPATRSRHRRTTPRGRSSSTCGARPTTSRCSNRRGTGTTSTRSPSRTTAPNLEGWTMLAALAQATSRLRLGAMVNGMHHRHPAVTANMAATLDHISGGRFELGIGAGWNAMESDAYGIPLGSPKERSDRFEEGIEVIVRCSRTRSRTSPGSGTNSRTRGANPSPCRTTSRS